MYFNNYNDELNSSIELKKNGNYDLLERLKIE